MGRKPTQVNVKSFELIIIIIAINCHDNHLIFLAPVIKNITTILIIVETIITMMQTIIIKIIMIINLQMHLDECTFQRLLCLSVHCAFNFSQGRCMVLELLT